MGKHLDNQFCVYIDGKPVTLAVKFEGFQGRQEEEVCVYINEMPIKFPVTIEDVQKGEKL